jgi:hypothetical protein
VGGRQYRAVPVPDVCTRYTCSPMHLQVPLSSSKLVRGGDAANWNANNPIVMRRFMGSALGGDAGEKCRDGRVKPEFERRKDSQSSSMELAPSFSTDSDVNYGDRFR